MSRPGYWATHEYKRGSIKKDSDTFLGYKYLERNIFDPLKPSSSTTKTSTSQWRMYQALIAALFQTGGRISEVLDLQRSNFFLNTHPDLVVIQRMLLLKRYEKIDEYWEYVDKQPRQMATGALTKIGRMFKKHGKKYRRKRWKTKNIEERRDLSFPKTEPLYVKYLLPYLKNVKEGKLFKVKYNSVYSVLHKLPVEESKPFSTPKYYNPHWFRGQRAAQLRIEYGFDTLDLKNFFGWKSDDMAGYYARLGGIPIGEKMLRRIG